MSLFMYMEEDVERYILVLYIEDWCKLGIKLKKENVKDRYEEI